MPRGARTRLFHAVVGLGFAACGGATTAASSDAGSDAMTRDAAGVDTGVATDANGANDVTSFSDAHAGQDDGSFDASADAAHDAADASADADADAPFIVPVQ